MPWTRVRLNAFGGPEELELETVSDRPEPATGEVRIRVLVTSAAFTDVMIRKGMYPDVKEKPPEGMGLTSNLLQIKLLILNNKNPGPTAAKWQSGNGAIT